MSSQFDRPNRSAAWGMGSVLRQAGGSTGQSKSGENWTRVARTVNERYNASQTNQQPKNRREGN